MAGQARHTRETIPTPLALENATSQLQEFNDSRGTYLGDRADSLQKHGPNIRYHNQLRQSLDPGSRSLPSGFQRPARKSSHFFPNNVEMGAQAVYKLLACRGLRPIDRTRKPIDP